MKFGWVFIRPMCTWGAIIGPGRDVCIRLFVETLWIPIEDRVKTLRNGIIQHFLSRKSGSRALSQRKCEICAMSWLRILSHSGCASCNVKAAYYLILITKHPPQSPKLRKAKWKQVGPLFWAEPCRVFFPIASSPVPPLQSQGKDGQSIQLLRRSQDNQETKSN